MNFIITGKRNTTLPRESNSDTMAPPVRSRSPQTPTYVCALKIFVKTKSDEEHFKVLL